MKPDVMVVDTLIEVSDEMADMVIRLENRGWHHHPDSDVRFMMYEWAVGMWRWASSLAKEHEKLI